jgi:hypothetical protein
MHYLMMKKKMKRKEKKRIDALSFLLVIYPSFLKIYLAFYILFFDDTTQTYFRIVYIKSFIKKK